MKILNNSPLTVNAEEAPYGCLFFDPVDKRAHFECREHAEKFNIDHMDWRVTHENGDVPVPLAYQRLPGGVFCDPVKRTACFENLRSAWIFYQLHTDYAVDWLDSVYRDVNDMFYFGNLSEVFDYLRSLGLDTPEAKGAENA